MQKENRHEIKISFDLNERELGEKLLAVGRKLDFINRMEGLNEVNIIGDEVKFISYNLETYFETYKFENNDLVYVNSKTEKN